jgi:hypothetical protein
MTVSRRAFPAAAAASVLILALGCGAATPDTGEQTWIDATGDPQTEVIARQFRGLDVAMIEMDHRYAELYFAGQDGNWDYAAHQVEHMELALELALERRPARAVSATGHFFPALRRMERVVAAEDGAAFGEAFEGLRRACNACHQAEDEPAFVVGVPAQRRTSIGGD